MQNNPTTFAELFGREADPEANKIQDAKHAIGMAKQAEAARLLKLAAMNDMYIANSTNPRMRAIYVACAAEQRAQAEALWHADDTAKYDSIGQRL